ncbi:MAG: helix-turn-helix transcriptional regulator [Blautia sp.]|nr:helix-turn-helix transcriptional regulator [Blautia sp.]
MAFDIMKLFEDEGYVSPGSIGGKIKKIRELRGLTQKELGIKCGFSLSTADVRIAQYEKNKKVPREKALKDITGALNIDEWALFDADLLPYNRMYHALFDMEDFHGLHPVKKDDGIYLEFSGHTTLGQDINRHDFYDFLQQWYDMYQKYLPTSADTKEEKEHKAKEYALWRYEYPQNAAAETTKRIQNHMKMNSLQAQIDALNAEMQTESELARIDAELKSELDLAHSSYKDIKKESELILVIKDLLDEGVPIERFTPESRPQLDLDHIHILSIKTNDLILYKSYFARFMCCIETMQKAGINIDRKITSKNKELYLTYEIVSSQYKYIDNLLKHWEDMIYISERIGSWSDADINDLNNRFLNEITTDDVAY